MGLRPFIPLSMLVALSSWISSDAEAGAASYGLGQGMFERQQIGADTCVTGDIAMGNASFQEVTTDYAGNQTFNLHEATGKMALGVHAGLFGVGGELDMATSAKNRSDATTVLFTYRMTAKEVFLTNVHVIAGKENALCGDHFVRARHLGGRLYIAYTVHFKDEAQKKHFSQKVTVSLLFGLFKKTYTKEKIDDKEFSEVKIGLKVWQFGGQEANLHQLYDSLAPNTCTVATADKCAANLKAYLNYAQNDFATQLETAVQNHQWDQLDVQQVSLNGYDDLGISGVSADPNLLTNMANKRRALLDQVQAIKANPLAQATAAANGASGSDLDALEAALQDCSQYDRAPQCLR